MKVNLSPMTQEEYDSYIEPSIKSYAKEGAKANDISIEEAMVRAKEQFKELLPQGLQSKGQIFLTIKTDMSEDSAGILWIGEKERKEGKLAFIYDIYLNKEFRSKGIGRETLIALESIVKKEGMHTIGLHVFYHNEIAVKLYNSLGYSPENRGKNSMTMRKSI